MAYVDPNFTTKKELRQAVARGEKVTVFDPAGLGHIPQNGLVTVEGPHYPKPHMWYARVTIKDGIVSKVM